MPLLDVFLTFESELADSIWLADLRAELSEEDAKSLDAIVYDCPTATDARQRIERVLRGFRAGGDPHGSDH